MRCVCLLPSAQDEEPVADAHTGSMPAPSLAAMVPGKTVLVGHEDQ